MNLRAGMGLGLVVVYLGGGYLRITSQRRSGATPSFRHPVLDNLLLLISGLLPAAAWSLALGLFKIQPHSVEARFFAYLLLLTLGGAWTWFCNDSPPREEMKVSLANNLSGLDRTSQAFGFHSSLLKEQNGIHVSS